MIRILKYGEVKNEEIFARTIPTDSVEDVVAEIIANVRANGDKALLEYEAKFKTFFVVPPLDEREDNSEILQQFLAKLGIINY